MNARSNDPVLQLLAAMPAGARRVLELGCTDGRLGQQFKALQRGAHWCGVTATAAQAACAAPHIDRAVTLDLDLEAGRLALAPLAPPAGFDTVVIHGLLERLHAPEALLGALGALTRPDARLLCALPHMGHLSVIERLVAGDIAYGADSAGGLLDPAHIRFFSPASAFKALLDSGWLPHLQDQTRAEVQPTAFTAAIVNAAQALGLPAETALRQLGLQRMLLLCQKWAGDGAAAACGPAADLAPFSVIVPVNRPAQYDLNIARSPGLREIGADIVCVQGARSAADAFNAGLARARHPWRLFVHQDVYFPSGSGHAIARQLAALQQAGLHGAPVGFAGIEGASADDGAARHAGLVIDRTALFKHPRSAAAVSLDEFAVALHDDSSLAIDPALGWHLWATDLCLQALQLAQQPIAQILEVPLFHNSTTGYVLPEAFHASARVLLAKYPQHASIATLCGLLTQPVAAARGQAAGARR
jgi:hypothetical protein